MLEGIRKRINRARSERETSKRKLDHPILIIFTAMTIVTMVNKFVKYHEYFEFVISFWRAFLRWAWSHVFEFLKINFGVSIEAEFSELLTFAGLVIAIAWRTSRSGRPYFDDAYFFSKKVAFFSLSVWTIAGYAFFAQLYNHTSWVSFTIIRQLWFQTLFMFSGALLLFAVLPERFHFKSELASIKMRSAALASIACLLLGSYFFQSFPNRIKELATSNNIAITQSNDHSSQQSFESPYLNTALDCDRTFNPPQSLHTDAQLDEIAAFLETYDANTLALEAATSIHEDSDGDLSEVKALSSFWAGLEPEIPAIAKMLALSEFQEREFFSYSYLAVLTELKSETEIPAIEKPIHAASIAAHRARLSEHYDAKELAAWIESNLVTPPSDDWPDQASVWMEHGTNIIGAYTNDFKEESRQLVYSAGRFDFQEKLCEYELGGYRCHFLLPAHKDKYSEGCDERSDASDPTCFMSPTGEQVYVALLRSMRGGPRF